MKNGIVGFRHAGVNVKDMDVARAFYEQVLGLELISDRVSDDGGRFVGAGDTAVRICVLRVPGTESHIELLEYRDADGAPSSGKPVDFGVAHASFWVKDIDELYGRLIAKNVPVHSAPIVPPSGRKKFYASDPDGFLLEFTEENP
jgi:lactoylglutathione lyase